MSAPSDPAPSPSDGAASALPGGIATADLVVVEFLSELLAARALGDEPPLQAWLQRYPRFEQRIATEWLRLHGATDATAAPLPPPGATRFADYRLVRELGRGGQGVVYLARDERLQRDVALKIVRAEVPTLHAAPSLRFAREAAALARVDHPALGTIYDAGVDGDSHWIAMKFVAGPSLEQHLAEARSRGSPPATAGQCDAAARLIERLARGLHCAHAAGLVHRDIKPSNVLLAAIDAPVLVDFGLARADDTPAAITLPGVVPGTASYLAPELLAGRSADARSDVWSLGACLFELLTLTRPFAAATLQAELQARALRAVPDVRRVNAAIPRDLAIIATTALAAEPERRYATAAAFADDLERFLLRQPIAARPASALLTLRRWLQRNRALGATLAALLLVLVAALGISLVLLHDTREALADVTRLSDRRECETLQARADALYPLREDRIAGAAGIDAWLHDTDVVLWRRPLHVQALERLPVVAEDNLSSWQSQQLAALLSQLDALAKRRERVAANREFARTVRQRSLVDAAPAWRAAMEAIAAAPVYHGLRVVPQLGLVPLGADPQSGLYEFAHLQSGAVPVRGSDGRLELGADSGIVLVLVPGGDAVLGAATTANGDDNVDPDATTDEGPCHRLALRPFLLSKYELTQAQWRRQTGTDPANYSPASELEGETVGERNPVETVSWTDADRVLRELDLALPTEAQWELAYRAGSHSPFPYGPTAAALQGHENLADADARRIQNAVNWAFEDWLHDGHRVHAPVGSFAPNRFGLHDLGGNVREWCADSWETYGETPPREGDGYRFGRFVKYRVIRGGAFNGDARQARASYRNGLPVPTAAPDTGVRPARRIDP